MATKCGDVGNEIVKKGYGVNKKIGKKYEYVNKGRAKDYEFVSKKFGFSRVLWKIKDPCITTPLKGKVFCVSEFYVRSFRLTRWEMSLERSRDDEGKDVAFFCLKRLQCDSFYGNAVADCFLEYSDDHGETRDLEFNHNFGIDMNIVVRKKAEGAGIIPTVDDHKREFKLKLEILVYFEDLKETIPLCENLGLRRLSEHLGHLYDNGVEADFRLFFLRRRLLMVHKAILFSRITDTNFRSLIISGNGVIDFEDDFIAENAEKVLKFLYTGNLSYTVLSDPSVAVFKFAEYIDVKAILAYYNPEEITFISDTDVEEISVTWTIEEFRSQDDNCLQSPIVKMMDTKWQIKVFPKGFRNEVYLDIYLVYAVTVSKTICVEIFMQSGSEGRISYRCHKQITCDGKLKTNKFIKLDEVANNYMRDDSLTIDLRLRMSPGQANPPVCVESKTACKYLSEQKHYDHLSDDILSLYQNERFYDETIHLNHHNIVLCIHKCILEARCPFLLDSLKHSRYHYRFNNISIAIIFEIIYFVYSGKLLDRSLLLPHIFDLYRAAEDLRYHHLNEFIIEKLQTLLSRYNARIIHEFAIAREIENLQDAALNFL